MTLKSADHPPQIPPSVLWIEDIPATVRGAKLRLESKTRLGVTQSALNYDDARALLTVRSFACVVLDLKLPRSKDTPGDLIPDLGKVLIQELKSGEFGNENLNVPFVIHTGQTNYVDAEVAALDGYSGAFQKVDDIDPMLDRVVQAVMSQTEGLEVPKSWRVPGKVLVRPGGIAQLLIESWSPEPINMHAVELPREVLVQLVQAGGQPVFVTIDANLGAESAEDLRVRNMIPIAVPHESEVWDAS